LADEYLDRCSSENVRQAVEMHIQTILELFRRF
jgi:hypothetical protein